MFISEESLYWADRNDALTSAARQGYMEGLRDGLKNERLKKVLDDIPEHGRRQTFWLIENGLMPPEVGARIERITLEELLEKMKISGFKCPDFHIHRLVRECLLEPEDAAKFLGITVEEFQGWI